MKQTACKMGHIIRPIDILTKTIKESSVRDKKSTKTMVN